MGLVCRLAVADTGKDPDMPATLLDEFLAIGYCCDYYDL